jgi:hypothetical protein
MTEIIVVILLMQCSVLLSLLTTYVICKFGKDT